MNAGAMQLFKGEKVPASWRGFMGIDFNWS